MSKTYSKTRTLVECALMIALGTVLANIKIFEMPNGGSLTGCALKTGYPSWRTRSPGARASIGTMGSGRKTGKGRFPIRTDCALLLILRWRNAPLIWTNFSI